MDKTNHLQGQPSFPACQVKGHDHPLTAVFTVTQQGTGQVAYMLECPTGRYRFFYIDEVWQRLHTMMRHARPRYGWPKVPDYATAL
jgi:hypothetical protein